MVETWIDPEYLAYTFLGTTRRIRIQEPQTGIWSTPLDAATGLCEACTGSDEQKKVAEQAMRQAQELRAKIVEVVGGEHAYERHRFDKYQPATPSQESALARCLRFLPADDNLLLIGPTGVGKSHLAGAIAHECVKQGVDVQRWRVTQLLRYLRYERKGQEEEAIIRQIVQMPALILEDLGIQKETDWSSAVLWEIIDRRIDAGRNGLVVTTNHGRGKMADNMGDKVPSRLSQICAVLRIEGPDARVATERPA